jgi:hypothetical protein
MSKTAKEAVGHDLSSLRSQQHADGDCNYFLRCFRRIVARHAGACEPARDRDVRGHFLTYD